MRSELTLDLGHRSIRIEYAWVGDTANTMTDGPVMVFLH